MKSLLPSLRAKKRYIAFEVISDYHFNKEEAYNAIKDSVKSYIGTLGLSESGLMSIDIWHNNKGIIKVNHHKINLIKAALTLTNNINNKKAMIRTLGISGILNKAQKKYLI
ncbi:MAG: ribonuclease P [Candidatus Woesearchaeota archaeon]|nr:MAG: ribonuclease P [Candidatus Woesearchaeota archaeon]